MLVILLQGPEGSPNFCFGLYEARKNGKCLEFIQSDWDYAGLASRLGWSPCRCGRTDGTVDCQHKKAGEMLADAFDFLRARDGRRFRLSYG